MYQGKIILGNSCVCYAVALLCFRTFSSFYLTYIDILFFHQDLIFLAALLLLATSEHECLQKLI